tara:strand:- start:300 stop:815 length:516 start_codon:yes stop_codon:yes gene_type:complete
MGGGVNKKILSEISIIYGKVLMPKGFEINRKHLSKQILESNINDYTFPFSKNWDMLNTFIRDHVNVEHSISLINKQTWGDTYKPQEVSIPLLNIDTVDLRNSPDYTCLYGVQVNKCNIRIHYDDNRRKGKSWDIPLENNDFIMFPSTCMYYLTNKQKDSLNFVQTITYEYI